MLVASSALANKLNENAENAASIYITYNMGQAVGMDNNDGEGPDSNSGVKANGWKLATRTEFGFINRDSVWAKNKVASPFIVPPTEQDVYLSDNSDDDMMIELSPAPSPVKGNSTTRNASPAKSIGGS